MGNRLSLRHKHPHGGGTSAKHTKRPCESSRDRLCIVLSREADSLQCQFVIGLLGETHADYQKKFRSRGNHQKRLSSSAMSQ